MEQAQTAVRADVTVDVDRYAPLSFTNLRSGLRVQAVECNLDLKASEFANLVGDGKFSDDLYAAQRQALNTQ
jgi:hypothetical protein